MRPASLAAVVVFSLVAAAHLLRVVLGTEVLVGGAIVPAWVSILGTVVPGALAIALWREAHGAPAT